MHLLITLVGTLLLAQNAFGAPKIEPIANPFNGHYAVVSEGCRDLETPVEPGTRRDFSIELAKVNGVRIFSYGENGAGDWGLWFYETSPSTDYQSSFTLSDNEFSGSLVLKTGNGYLMVDSAMKRMNDDTLLLIENREQVSSGTRQKAELCRRYRKTSALLANLN